MRSLPVFVLVVLLLWSNVDCKPQSRMETGAVSESTTESADCDCANDKENPEAKICGYGYECVQNHLCVNGTILTTGEGILNERFDEAERLSCPDTHTCCFASNRIVESDSLVSVVSKPTITIVEVVTPEVKPDVVCGGGLECVPENFCIDGKINTGGIGLFNERIDVCPEKHVCCAYEPDDTDDPHPVNPVVTENPAHDHPVVTTPVEHIDKSQICEPEYECVPHHLCLNGQVNTNGEGLLDERIKPDDSGHIHCPEDHTCCYYAKNTTEDHHEPTDHSTHPEVTTPIQKIDTTTEHVPHIPVHEPNTEVTTPSNKIEEYQVCGAAYECVPHNLCVDGTINTDGGGLFNERIQPDACPKTHTCCLPPPTPSHDETTPQVITDRYCEIDQGCVPAHLCNNGTINTDGSGLLDERMKPSRVLCPIYHTCCNLPTEFEPVYKLKKHEKCGVRNVYGGTANQAMGQSQFAEFPWVVAITYKVHGIFDEAISVFKCGGTLIHPSVVMTASHCLSDITDTHNITIRAGEWDTQSRSEPFPHQERRVVEILNHEHFKRRNLFNDISLLFLESPVDLAENVNTGCLPPQDANFDHQRCFVAGWGKDKFGQQGLQQVVLKRVQIPVVPSAACQEILRGTRLGRWYILNKSFICAGGEEGIDTCEGDGGAPLNCPIPDNEHNQHYITGQVAYGLGCYSPVPAVYVNVPLFRHWIDAVFDQRNLDKSYYTLH